MISIIKDIIDVAKALFGLKDSLAKANKQKRDEMADYFQAVSVCLKATYEKLSEDEVPHGHCAELGEYALSLPKVLDGFIEEDKALELSNRLERSHSVEGLWVEFNTNPSKKNQLQSIAEASGIFLALSNSVRAGYKPD
ncbi:MAG: hypothetical protein J7L04_02705 [Bacteroidales bacterium]|nr:hypothetical protein [Bacteroidales bacterium]